MPPTPAIATEGLRRVFDAEPAVDDLTLTVAAGETLALLGPNGAGKTTTVRMLCSLIAPSGGRARILGHDVVADAAKVRGSIGLLTETPGVYDRLTPLEILVFFGRLHGLEDPVAAARRYLELLELWERRDDPTGEFSKGMKQKVALARALLHEPRVLFLDEPTSGLDVPTARRVRRLVSRLRDEGRTILVTTHNLDEAERLADRIAVLDTRLVALGTPAELRHGLAARRVSVRLATSGPPGLEAIATRIGGIAAAELDGDRLRVSLADEDEHSVPDLVAALVGAGARIAAVEPEPLALEDVYLRLVGSGEEEEA